MTKCWMVKKNLTNYCDLKTTITNEQCLMALKYSNVKRVESKKKTTNIVIL